MTNSSHQKDPWFLGIDLGTGSCKSIVIDTQARLLGSGSSDYGKLRSASQWEEQDPEALITAMVHSARAAIDEASVSMFNCQGFSLGGAYHSLLAVDQGGEPLTGVMTWIDDRATKQAQTIRQHRDPINLYQQTGCPVHGMYPLYKLIWLKEEQPEIFRRSARFISAKEYVIHRLSGEYVVDYGIAAGSGLLNTHDLNWNPDSIDLAGISSNQLSSLVGPSHVLRNINSDIASEMGISKDTAMVLGSADAVNSSLGAGAVRKGQATCMVGTSGAFRVIASQPVLDAQTRTWCYAIEPGHWLVGGAINNGGLALSWFREMLNQIPQYASVNVQITFEDLIDLAGHVSSGSEGLICLPFFAGERSPYWNMNARGVFFGLTLHHNIRHFARAILEGVAFRLRSLKDALFETGQDIHQIRASGGFTHSHLWPQIIANVMDRELLVPKWGDTSSLGAALWAMIGTGVINQIEDVYNLISIGERYQPDPELSALYNHYYDIYLQLYLSLRDTFDQIADL